jgi:hypothetical protein
MQRPATATLCEKALGDSSAAMASIRGTGIGDLVDATLWRTLPGHQNARGTRWNAVRLQ